MPFWLFAPAFNREQGVGRGKIGVSAPVGPRLLAGLDWQTKRPFESKLSNVQELDPTRSGSTARSQPRESAFIAFLSALQFSRRANRRRL